MPWGDRVKETTSTTGTGTLTLSGAATQYQAFSTLGSGSKVQYCIEAGNGTDWEVGVGTIGSGSLSRDVIFASSNSGSAVSLTGTSTVFHCPTSRQFDYIPPYNYFRNSTFEFGSRWMNPDTATSVNDDAYGLDGINCLSQGATVSTNRASGTNARYAVQVTNNTGSTNRVGFTQMLETSDSYLFRGKPATFQIRVKSDEASKNIRVCLVEWTGTADSPTSDIVNTWTSGTFTAGNFFTTTSTTVVGTTQIACTSANTWYSGSITGTVSSSCNNLHACVVTESTLLDANSIWVECPGLYLGSSPQTWGALPRSAELARCQRYIYAFNGQQYIDGTKNSSGQVACMYNDFPTTMRATPTATVYGVTGWNGAAAGATQVAAYDRQTAGYVTITGALTSSAIAYSADRGKAYFGAGTSFSGSIGDVLSFDFGSSVGVYYDAEL